MPDLHIELWNLPLRLQCKSMTQILTQANLEIQRTLILIKLYENSKCIPSSSSMIPIVEAVFGVTSGSVDESINVSDSSSSGTASPFIETDTHSALV